MHLLAHITYMSVSVCVCVRASTHLASLLVVFMCHVLTTPSCDVGEGSRDGRVVASSGKGHEAAKQGAVRSRQRPVPNHDGAQDK